MIATAAGARCKVLVCGVVIDREADAAIVAILLQKSEALLVVVASARLGEDLANAMSSAANNFVVPCGR